VETPIDFTRGFPAGVPKAIRQWQSQLLLAGRTVGVNPWLLALVMWNESRGGAVLTPPGAGGTGDFIKRPPSHVTHRFADPRTGIPPAGHGWGLGLMQIDWGLHNLWATKNAWGDAQVNINKAAHILKEHLTFFSRTPAPDPTGQGGTFIDCWRLERGLPYLSIAPWRTKYSGGPPLPACSPTAKRVGPYKDVRPLSGTALYEAAMAAYNAGTSGVLQALVLGLPVDSPTTRQNYVEKAKQALLAWGVL